jgi:hypothetical protein
LVKNKTKKKKGKAMGLLAPDAAGQSVFFSPAKIASKRLEKANLEAELALQAQEKAEAKLQKQINKEVERRLQEEKKIQRARERDEKRIAKEEALAHRKEEREQKRKEKQHEKVLRELAKIAKLSNTQIDAPSVIEVAGESEVQKVLKTTTTRTGRVIRPTSKVLL